MKSQDIKAYELIDKNDQQRILRALEVYRGSGKKISTFWRMERSKVFNNNFIMDKKSFNQGLFLSAVGSFWWGFFGVLYFKYISFAGHIEVVVHRSLWTAVTLLVTTIIFSKWKIFKEIISNKKQLFILFLSGVLIFLNWAVWIYAVSSNQVINASFGYFIMPILSVFLGYILMPLILSLPFYFSIYNFYNIFFI